MYSRIDYEPGHTYGATDQAFGSSERYASRIETVYIPDQLYDHVRNASKSVEVRKQHFFRDYYSHLRKMYTERNKDKDKQNLDFKRIVWFNFGKGERSRWRDVAV